MLKLFPLAHSWRMVGGPLRPAPFVRPALRFQFPEPQAIALLPRYQHNPDLLPPSRSRCPPISPHHRRSLSTAKLAVSCEQPRSPTPGSAADHRHHEGRLGNGRIGASLGRRPRQGPPQAAILAQKSCQFPTSSFYFVSTEVTGHPRAGTACPGVGCSGTRRPGRMYLPSLVLALPCGL